MHIKPTTLNQCLPNIGFQFRVEAMLNESLARCWVSTEKTLNPKGLCINTNLTSTAGHLHFEMSPWPIPAYLALAHHNQTKLRSCLFLTLWWFGREKALPRLYERGRSGRGVSQWREDRGRRCTGRGGEPLQAPDAEAPKGSHDFLAQLRIPLQL